MSRAQYPGCQRLLFFFCERGERATRQSRVNEARSAEKKMSRLPSEPAKRLIFSPTIRQRASGTRVLTQGTSTTLRYMYVKTASDRASDSQWSQTIIMVDKLACINILRNERRKALNMEKGKFIT